MPRSPRPSSTIRSSRRGDPGPNEAALRQNQANRDLAKITWNRDQPLVAKGWTTRQQGTIDEQNLKALEAAVGVAQQHRSAAGALSVLLQQKAYQTVVAPFDGVVTQRNIDVGSLVQADATSGTFMFTVMQTNVIRAFTCRRTRRSASSPASRRWSTFRRCPAATFPAR